jgi:hypothetical protein
MIGRMKPPNAERAGRGVASLVASSHPTILPFSSHGQIQFSDDTNDEKAAG